MSRAAAGGPDGATGIGTTTDGPGSACGIHGTSTVAARSRRASTGRCQSPWRPGRVSAASASKRIAPGRGHSSAAVVVE